MVITPDLIQEVFKDMLRNYDAPKIPIQRTVIVSSQAIDRLKASGSYIEKDGEIFIDAPDHPFIHGVKCLEQPLFEFGQVASFPKKK